MVQAGSRTGTLTVAALFLVAGSGRSDATAPPFERFPALVTTTINVTVSAPPEGMAPRLHVSRLSARVHASRSSASLVLTNRADAGSVFVSVTPVARSGPRFATVNVYASLVPTNAEALDATTWSRRLA